MDNKYELAKTIFGLSIIALFAAFLVFNLLADPDTLYTFYSKLGIKLKDSSFSEQKSSTNQVTKTFLGSHSTGYSLWLGSDNCIYVKDLKQSDLVRNGTTLEEFKKAVEITTGKNCVLFE